MRNIFKWHVRQLVNTEGYVLAKFCILGLHYVYADQKVQGIELPSDAASFDLKNYIKLDPTELKLGKRTKSKFYSLFTD